MELLHTILAKAVAYQIFVIFGALGFLTLLTLWSLWRQRKVKKLNKMTTANFENLRSKLEDMVVHNKTIAQKQSAAIIQAIKETGERQKTGLAETAALSNRVDQLGSGLREGIVDLQQYVQGLAAAASSSGGDGIDPAALAEITARLEELADEMAWSHHYYDNLKTLEVAVEKLVGGEKMQQLVAKEKNGGAGRGSAAEDLVRKTRV